MSRGPGHLRNLFTMIAPIVGCLKGWKVSVVHELERAKPW
jgi:hypothetical protein